jgi:hypothetical protein
MRIDASAKHTAATRAEMSCSGSEKAGRRTSLSPRRHDTAVLAAMSWILSPRHVDHADVQHRAAAIMGREMCRPSCDRIRRSSDQ